MESLPSANHWVTAVRFRRSPPDSETNPRGLAFAGGRKLLTFDMIQIQDQ